MCLGLDTLVELCENYATTFDDSRTVTVGIVGWPGVGKSALLTQLKTLQDQSRCLRPTRSACLRTREFLELVAKKGKQSKVRRSTVSPSHLRRGKQLAGVEC